MRITSKIFWVLIIIAGILILIRLAMPYVLIRYVVNRINKIPEYRVKIEDLDVHLYRGSYTVKNISLHKITKNIPVPFFAAKTVDLAVEWGALLHGSFVAQIYALEPELNFVVDSKGNNEQLSINKEWENAVKALFPLNFNKVETNNGKISLHSYTGNPPFQIYLKNAHLLIENMQNANHTKKGLESNYNFTANTMDGADVTLKGKFDPFTKQPTFYLTATIKDMQIREANNFLRHYTAVDISKGNFSLYVEAAAAEGRIEGYAKPIIKNLQIINPSKPMGPVEAIYKGALEIISKIVTNPEKQTIATRINISGRIDDPDTSILSILGNLLSHAFIQALLPQIDHTVKMQDVVINGRKKSA